MSFFIIHSVNDILLKEFGRSISDENIHLLDPFTGSSTTGVIAKKYNRKFIGIDKFEDYLNLSIKRIYY